MFNYKEIPDIPGVNVEKGLALYGGDNDIFLSALRSFAANTPAVLDKLRDATAETLPGCVITAHGLKGSSASISAEGMRAAAAEMESMARNGDFAGFSTLRALFLKSAEQLVEDINVWFEAFDAEHEKPRRHAPSRETLAKLNRC